MCHSNKSLHFSSPVSSLIHISCHSVLVQHSLTCSQFARQDPKLHTCCLLCRHAAVFWFCTSVLSFFYLCFLFRTLDSLPTRLWCLWVMCPHLAYGCYKYQRQVKSVLSVYSPITQIMNLPNLSSDSQFEYEKKSFLMKENLTQSTKMTLLKIQNWLFSLPTK